MLLGVGFQAGLVAWQMVERASHLFLYMWSDAALRGRVDGEYASIRTAFHVSVHSTGAFIDCSLEHLCFPTVQESCVEAVPGGVAIGEYERLFWIQSVLCEGVELGGVPMNFNLDLGKSHRVFWICALSVGCEGNVGFVVVRIKILSIPAAREGNLGPKSARALENGECIMTRHLNQRIETEEGFVRGEFRFVL